MCPKLSLYKPNKTNDYKFLDNIISEQFQVGGLDIFIHKYLGVKTPAEPSGDATLPTYDETNPLFIEDLLLLENRNRTYEPDIYTMRGVYRTQDIDFDLSQFGLFMMNDTVFLQFHYNDMIDHIGRKLMNGDVLEFPNLKDYHPLDETTPKAIPKFYVVNDAAYGSDGFSQTWLPHLWRLKLTPLVGGQEYNDILKDYIDTNGDIDGDDGEGNGSGSLADYMCQHNKNIAINDALLTQAEVEVPLSGYDISSFYIVSYDEYGDPVNIHGLSVDAGIITADSSLTADSFLPTVDLMVVTADTIGVTTDEALTINSFIGYGVTVDLDTITVDLQEESSNSLTGGDTSGNLRLGYLVGDGLAPNGWPVTPGTSFPVNPAIGDHVLRLDYSPNRLFRYDGSTWVKIEDNLRTDIYLDGITQRSKFFNNIETVSTADRGDIPSRQSLSDLLRPESDN